MSSLRRVLAKSNASKCQESAAWVPFDAKCGIEELNKAHVTALVETIEKKLPKLCIKRVQKLTGENKSLLNPNLESNQDDRTQQLLLLQRDFEGMRVSKRTNKYRHRSKKAHAVRRKRDKFKRRSKLGVKPIIKPSKLSHIFPPSSTSSTNQNSLPKDETSDIDAKPLKKVDENDLSDCCVELETFSISSKSMKRKISLLQSTISSSSSSSSSNKRAHSDEECQKNLAQEEESATSAASNNEVEAVSCAQQAMSVDDLADLWLMVFPKKMSKMAEMMYT